MPGEGKSWARPWPGRSLGAPYRPPLRLVASPRRSSRSQMWSGHRKMARQTCSQFSRYMSPRSPPRPTKRQSEPAKVLSGKMLPGKVPPGKMRRPGPALKLQPRPAQEGRERPAVSKPRPHPKWYSLRQRSPSRPPRRASPRCPRQCTLSRHLTQRQSGCRWRPHTFGRCCPISRGSRAPHALDPRPSASPRPTRLRDSRPLSRFPRPLNKSSSRFQPPSVSPTAPARPRSGSPERPLSRCARSHALQSPSPPTPCAALPQPGAASRWHLSLAARPLQPSATDRARSGRRNRR
mmetsp:Transcript_54937/g.117908  ORF Transcript_54937/g.117908 Transcript_54937/m.117908 type:complete len:293 (-) Transcript_54937:122-1000(-)